MDLCVTAQSSELCGAYPVLVPASLPVIPLVRALDSIPYLTASLHDLHFLFPVSRLAALSWPCVVITASRLAALNYPRLFVRVSVPAPLPVRLFVPQLLVSMKKISIVPHLSEVTPRWPTDSNFQVDESPSCGWNVSCRRHDCAFEP